MKVLVFFVQVLYVLNCLASADQIFPAHLGGAFRRSSREPKYRIEFHEDLDAFGSDDGQESLVMPNNNGQNFICYLPKVEEAKSGKQVLQRNISSMIVETEKRIKMRTPDELLEVLEDQRFIRQEGWWSYEFCYHKRLREIHVEDDKVVQEFVLGVYDAEATAGVNRKLSDISTLKDPRSKDAYQRYHAHQYTNGTTCDLTDLQRETEVRFVCSEGRAMINSITEVSTCKYAVTIQFPELCKHPAFQSERPVWQTIDCNVLHKDYKETKAEEESKPVADADSEDPADEVLDE